MRITVVVGAALASLTLLGSGCSGVAGGAASQGGWRRLPDPPLTGRTGAVVQPVGDRVLVVGGWESLCPPNADCSYGDLALLDDGALLDPATGQWETISSPPFGVRDGSSAAIGDAAYLLTGCRPDAGCGGRPELLRYDVATDRWQELGTTPRPSAPYARLVAVGDQLLVLADSDENRERSDYLFDPATRRWQRVPDDPLPRVFDRRAVPDGDRLLIFGSPIPSAPDQSSGAKVAAALDLESRTWQPLPTAPGQGYQVWRSGDEAWLNPHFGDDGGGVLDLTTDRWTPFPERPAGWTGPTDLAGVLGHGTASYEYDAGWVRDTERESWLRIPERPRPTTDGERITSVGESLFVFGGQRWEDEAPAGEAGELVAEAWLWEP